MIYGYIRVSTDKQTTENQRFEILKFAHERHLSIDRWIEETISATKKLSDRKLGALIERMREEDIVVSANLLHGFDQSIVPDSKEWNKILKNFPLRLRCMH